MQKHSKQRASILRNLQERHDHPTADMIFESVREEQPNISLGTVYRNLALLAENGQIIKLATGIGGDHYDGNPNPHSHFICKNCGKVQDINYISEEEIIKHAAGAFSGMIDGYDLRFFGTCEECL